MSTTEATPTIHVLGVSSEDASGSLFSSLHEDAKSNASPQLRLHGRIAVVRTQDASFDQVNVQVHGAIRNKIGSKVAVERFSSSTEEFSVLDFKPAYSASSHRDTQSREEHLDFSCLVPTVSSRRSVHKRGGNNDAEEDKDDEVVGAGVVPTTTTTRGHHRRHQHDGFIPSMSISGSTYVTRVTAIRDRHLVQGSCEVIYWLEAVFLNSRHNQNSRVVVRRLTCPVDISSPNTPLQVELSPSSSSSPDRSNKNTSTSAAGTSGIITQIAKPRAHPHSWTKSLRCLSSQSQPELSVTLSHTLGHIVSDSTRLATGCRRLSIPVSVNVGLPTHTRARPSPCPRQATRSLSSTTGGPGPGPTDSLECSIKSQWYTRRSFNTEGSSRGAAGGVGPSIASDTVSTHRTTLVLPPLYREPDDDSTYTTSVDLNVLLPESSTVPSVSSDVLSVSHDLDLAMQFEFVDGSGVKTAYTADFRNLPVTLRMAELPQDALTQCTFDDPLLGYVEDDVRYAPPPYIG